jgi:hypothetical protein
MKKAVLIVFVFLAFIATDANCQKNRNQVKVKPDSVAVDSVEYELIVLDPGFESWLSTKPSMNFYSKEYYETRNRLYVTEWNIRNLNPIRYGDLYDTAIEYFPNIDYGLELNYRLYYYFRFFEETNRVKLIDTGR